MPLGMEVGLGPGDIVLDGGPAPPPPKAHTPNFRPMSTAAKWSPISVSVINSVGHTDNNRIIVIISVCHTDTKFYYQCGILKLIQQMAPHYCPKY